MKHKKLVLRAETIRRVDILRDTILRDARGGALPKSKGTDCSVDDCNQTRQCTHPC